MKHRDAAVLALPALNRLAQVLKGRSGQPYKVRALLYSLWNGKPVQLNEILNLDWPIREDLCWFMLGFGYEDLRSKDPYPVKCFYTAIEEAVQAAGQWEWFLEERFEYAKLEEYARSCRSEAEENERETRKALDPQPEPKEPEWYRGNRLDTEHRIRAAEADKRAEETDPEPEDWR